tara:strand:+ start:18658 stop:20526 length:1869 start_codon:yes stop_codon:yes gene_type:complete
VTPPYNADFDGDEMNLHKVDKQCSLDARLLMGVENNMIGAAYNNVQIRAVQDFTLSMYLKYGLCSSKHKKQLQDIICQKGPVQTCKHLHEQQLSAFHHMEARGFSVGLDDFSHTVPPVTSGRMALSKTADVIVNLLPPENRLKIMSADAKSKGSVVNLVQLFSCVGYQTVRGVASLAPRFAPASSSFVSSSFVEGLDPTEFWHHATAAREGMIETAIKTAKCGYIMRKLVKLLENVRVEYDDTVRSNGRVIQFRYGGDGYDATKLIRNHERCKPIGASCFVDPGEPVGIMCAQCIGHPLTQMTLDTFHSAGIAQDHGIAAVERLLSIGTSATHRVFGLQRPYVHVRVCLKDVLLDAVNEQYHTFSDRQRFQMALHNQEGKNGAPLAVLPIDKDALAALGISPWQLASSIYNKIQHGTYLVDEDGECTRILCIGACVDTSMVIGSKWALKDASMHCNGVVSCAPFELINTDVYTSDVNTVASMLGIEAARAVLTQELTSKLGGIDCRHILLLTDYMTHTGKLRGIDRTALKDHSPSDVISNASFESAINVVADAARKRQTDRLSTVSSRLTMGLMPKIGTGAFDILQQHGSESKSTANSTCAAQFLHGSRCKKRTFAQLMQSI